MSHGIGVGTREALDGMATPAVSAFGQGMTAQQQRELERAIQQSTREQLQAVRAAHEAALTAQRSQLVQEPALPSVPAPPAPPVSGVVVTPQGQRIVIGGGDAAGRGPVAVARGQGQNQDIQFFAPNVPPEIVVISIAFFVMLVFIAVGMPLARAFARRMDRQGSRPVPSPFPSDVSDRIERIEQAVEAIAIEVERVSEGQRFTTKLLSEMRSPSSLAVGEPRS